MKLEIYSSQYFASLMFCIEEEVSGHGVKKMVWYTMLEKNGSQETIASYAETMVSGSS